MLPITSDFDAVGVDVCGVPCLGITFLELDGNVPAVRLGAHRSGVVDNGPCTWLAAYQDVLILMSREDVSRMTFE